MDRKTRGSGRREVEMENVDKGVWDVISSRLVSDKNEERKMLDYLSRYRGWLGGVERDHKSLMGGLEDYVESVVEKTAEVVGGSNTVAGELCELCDQALLKTHYFEPLHSHSFCVEELVGSKTITGLALLNALHKHKKDVCFLSCLYLVFLFYNGHMFSCRCVCCVRRMAIVIFRLPIIPDRVQESLCMECVLPSVCFLFCYVFVLLTVTCSLTDGWTVNKKKLQVCKPGKEIPASWKEEDLYVRGMFFVFFSYLVFFNLVRL